MDELAKRFAELSEQYGPSVIETAKAAARTQAYSCLVSSVLFFGIALALGFGGLWLWRRAWDIDSKWDEGWATGSVILWVIASICIISGLWAWIDPWTWMTIQHPELWIAKRTLHL